MKKAKNGPGISDAIAILDRRIRNKPELKKLVEQAKIDCDVAQLIYDARTEANLTQKELAALVGTTQSVIARLEDADYEGRSLTMLNRIASALHRRVEIRLLPEGKRQAA